MKVVIRPSVLAAPLLKAGALLPVTLAALLLMSGSLLAAPKQDSTALTQALFPAPVAELATPGSAQLRFTTYEQITGFLKPIGAQPGAQVYSLLKTSEGREIWAVKLANPKAKLRVMFISRVHGDEPGASEGALQLLAALTAGELKGQFDAVEIVIVPMANPDGSTANQRRTAAGGDINRDFIAGAYAETRALQAEIQAFDPHVVVDAHEFTVWGRLGEKTIAADLMTAGPNEPNLPAELVDVNDRLFRGAIDRGLAAAGLRHQLYELLSTDAKSGALQVAESATTFVSAKNFHAMGGRVSLLLEGRGIGLGDQHLTRRTLAQYLAMKAVVQTAQAQADTIGAALATARTKIQGLKTWELGRLPIKQSRDFPLADSVTNTIVKVPAEFTNRTHGKPGPTIEVPHYYLVPQAQKAMIDQLVRMGIEVKTLAKPLTAVVGVQTADFKVDGKTVKAEGRTLAAQRSFAVGDYVIDTRQRGALYLQILEVASPNSLAAAGAFGTVNGTELPIYRFSGAL